MSFKSLVGPVSALMVLLMLGAASSAAVSGRAGSSIDDDDVCSLLNEAINATGVCTLGKCSPAKTTVSCLVEIPDPLTGNALDNVTAAGEIVICAKPGAPASIKLTVGDTVLGLSKSKTWKSGDSEKVPILPIPVVPGVEADVDATVGFSVSPASAHIGMGIDVCVTAGISPLKTTVCGASLLPGTLPIVVVNDTFKIDTFCNPPKPPPPPPKPPPPPPSPGHPSGGGDGSWEDAEHKDNGIIYIAIAVGVGVVLMAVGFCYLKKVACFKDKGDQIDPRAFAAASNLQ